MADGKPGQRKPKRARVEARVTVEEAAALRDRARDMNMSVTEYILYKTLYEPDDCRGEVLRGVWDELAGLSIQLSELTDAAKTVARQPRAAEARALSSSVLSSIGRIEPALVDSMGRLASTLESEYPSERRRNAVS